MKQVKYVGDRGPVEIEVGPQQWRTVEPGEVIEVPDEMAAGLCDQESMWQPSRRKTTKAVKAADEGSE